MPDLHTADTKIAIVVRHDLAAWQKLNVTAFLASGIAAAAPEAIGQPYVDRGGHAYGGMFVQPVLVFRGDLAALQAACQQARTRGLTTLPYVEAMFATGHDAANRAVFAEEDPEAPNLVGLAVRGPRKAVDKAVKGLKLHD
jgi:hypothetical protein